MPSSQVLLAPKEGLRILLTGGTGLLGGAISRLLGDAHRVTHLDLVKPSDDLPWIEADLRDAQAVEKACRGQDVIIHAGALHGRAWAAAGDHAGFEINVLGTQNVLEGARKGGVRRVIWTSSIWATGHAPVPPPYLPIDELLPREPDEIYGLTKKLGEQMCRFASQRYGLSTICLRPGGICPADAPLQTRFGHLFSTVDVRDVAQAHIKALGLPESVRHEVFVITAESPLCNVDPVRFFMDRNAVLEEIFPGITPLLEQGTLKLPANAEWYTIEKARRLLGYEPRFGFEMPVH